MMPEVSENIVGDVITFALVPSGDRIVTPIAVAAVHDEPSLAVFAARIDILNANIPRPIVDISIANILWLTLPVKISFWSVFE
jgi:hypothetical protein